MEPYVPVVVAIAVGVGAILMWAAHRYYQDVDEQGQNKPLPGLYGYEQRIATLEKRTKQLESQVQQLDQLLDKVQALELEQAKMKRVLKDLVNKDPK